jgi:hypothetical protein
MASVKADSKKIAHKYNSIQEVGLNLVMKQTYLF